MTNFDNFEKINDAAVLFLYLCRNTILRSPSPQMQRILRARSVADSLPSVTIIGQRTELRSASSSRPKSVWGLCIVFETLLSSETACSVRICCWRNNLILCSRSHLGFILEEHLPVSFLLHFSIICPISKKFRHGFFSTRFSNFHFIKFFIIPFV